MPRRRPESSHFPTTDSGSGDADGDPIVETRKAFFESFGAGLQPPPPAPK